MKNKIILLLTVFCLTGCSINYNLTIDENNNYQEEIKINSLQKSNYSKKEMFDLYTEEYPIYMDEEFIYYNPTEKNKNYTYYNKSYEELTDGYNFVYKSNYKFKDFHRARSINTAFKDAEIAYIDREGCYLLTLNNCIIFDYNSNIDDIVVNITFKNANVIESNADSISNNTYTFNINKNNNIRIKYKLNNNKTSNEQIIVNNEVKKSNEMSIYIGIGALLFFILFLIVVLKLKKKF